MREKKIAIISVKVYAVAIYADLASTPATGGGKTAEELASDPAFFAGIANGEASHARLQAGHMSRAGFLAGIHASLAGIHALLAGIHALVSIPGLRGEAVIVAP